MTIKAPHLALIISLLFCVSCSNSNYDMKLSVELNSHASTISPTMYGVFFEEINHAGEGGLYAELLMNRSFEDRVIPDGYKVENGELIPPIVNNYITGKPTPCTFKWGTDPYPGWELHQLSGAKAAMATVTENPHYDTAPTSMKVDVQQLGNGVSLINKGFWGISLKAGGSYRLRIIARSNTGNTPIRARLLSDKNKLLAESLISLSGDGTWHDYTTQLTSCDSTSTGHLTLDLPKNGTYYFDYVSLFPTDTYKGRENGMRKDVAMMIENLKPKFIRWPGGCIVEGITLNNRVQWKQTIGDPAARSGCYDTWGYRNSYGFGYKEFLDFCEDLGAKAMYVCNVGIACYGRTGEFCSESQVGDYIKDALDAIEYAVGDVGTPWGSVRAKEGHPAPYPLKYVEIGNENFGPIYDRRYNQFFEAIKARYPQLILISNYGVDGSKNAKKIEMVDPHWYVEPERFFRDAYLFDDFKRGQYDVYVGEYSCNDGVGTGNMLAALSEAAFLTGVERNSDVVKMASYAPLFEHKHDRSWPVNLIALSGNQVVGRSSYYVQNIFANNIPTYNLKTQCTIEPEVEHEALTDYDGYIAFNTNDGKIDIRDIQITQSNGERSFANLKEASQWNFLDDSTKVWKSKKVGPGTVISFDVKGEEWSKGLSFYWGLVKTNLEKALSLNIGKEPNSLSLDRVYWNTAYPFINQSFYNALAVGKWHKMQVSIHRDGFQCSVDGKAVWSYQMPLINRRFQVAGFDEKRNEVVVKVVNASDKACNSLIDLNGREVKSKGKVITLKAKSKQDENSFEEPNKIVPVESEYSHFSSSFTYLFEPNSVTVLRIGVK